MTRIPSKIPYAIAMAFEVYTTATKVEPTKYWKPNHITVRPGDICYTCLMPLKRDDVFRCLVVSSGEMYVEHEHHRDGGHMRINHNGIIIGEWSKHEAPII